MENMIDTIPRIINQKVLLKEVSSFKIPLKCYMVIAVLGNNLKILHIVM